MPTGGTLRFAEREVEERDAVNRTVEKNNCLKFRARMQSDRSGDVHREFTGGYYPRFRSMYVSEICERKNQIVLKTMYDMDVYQKKEGGKEDYYYTEDFVAGAKLQFPDHVFVVTDVDKSRLRYSTKPAPKGPPKPPGPGASVLERIRYKVTARCSHGEEDGRLTMTRLGKHFRVLDDSGDRKIGPAEFKKALTEYRLDLTPEEADLAMREFDSDGDGNITYDEFIEAIRGPMSEARKICVRQAFKKIDYNKDGQLTFEDFKHFYNAKYHPKVMNGEITEEEAIMKFAGKFERGEKDGLITWDEFQDYYNGVSASIDDDEHFIFMMERAWNLDKRNATKTPFR